MRIVHLLFPDLTLLDMVGPAQVFSSLPGVEQFFAWHRIEPVPTDAAISVLPTTTMSDAPPADVLFVPGGHGAFPLLDDPSAMDFVHRQAEGARLVTSVCTGSFILAGAGLLTARRATTHWSCMDLLSAFGAIPTRKRVVVDGNVITGAGVTSGIDFALTVTAQLAGENIAKARQLSLEYAPAPPFDAGEPGRPDADPQQVAATTATMASRWGPTVTRAADRRSMRSRSIT